MDDSVNGTLFLSLSVPLGRTAKEQTFLRVAAPEQLSAE